jgi:hypothetical protein
MDITIPDSVAILSYGLRLAVAWAEALAEVLRAVSAVVAPVIGVVSVVAVASTEAVPAVAGNSHQISDSPFFPMECFVPLQIP